MEDIFSYTDNFKIYKDVKSYLLWGDVIFTPNPKVSIIMPIFNHPDFFKDALESAINQDCNDIYEIVIVDNTDYSEEPTINQKIVEELNNSKILYYRNSKNIGMFGNFNRGIELARSEFVTFLHDDDMLMPNTLSSLLEYSQISGNGCIIGARIFVDKKGQEILKYPPKDIFCLKDKMFYKKNYLDVIYEGSTSPAGEAALWRKKHLLSIGGFNIDYYPSSDFAMEVCYLHKFGAYFLNRPLLKYRISDNESYSVYSKWYEKDKWILNCLIKKMKLPQFVLGGIINAKLNIQKISNEIKWGKKNMNIRKEIDFIDRLIFKLFSIFYLISSIGRKKRWSF